MLSLNKMINVEMKEDIKKIKFEQKVGYALPLNKEVHK